MSRSDRGLSLADAGELEREQVIFRAQAHNGQHPETEAKYRDAIAACSNILYLDQPISAIASMYGLDKDCLSNQLKRHYPELIPMRRELRIKMGYEKAGRYGLKSSTVTSYFKAIEMLKDPSVTVRAAAQACGVSYSGLQQHLLFYHKEIADARMITRTDALFKSLVVGGNTGKGGIRVPRPGALALYAPAVELYRTTRKSIVEIARLCGVPSHNLSVYLQRWHRDLMEQRRERVRKELNEKKIKEDANRHPKGYLAKQKYEPAIALIKSGYSFREAAQAQGLSVPNLSRWIKRNYPELWELHCAQSGHQGKLDGVPSASPSR